MPTTAWPLTSATSSMPAAAIRGPPIPMRRTPGWSSRRARHRVAPCRSPEASPAESRIEGSGLIDAHHRDACGIRPTDQVLSIDEEHAPRFHRERRRAALGHRVDRAWGRSPGCRSGSRGQRATALTTTAPGPDSRAPRRIASSVPSMASTATVTPKHRTTVWPMPCSARWRASVAPLADLRPLRRRWARAPSGRPAAPSTGRESPADRGPRCPSPRASPPPSGRARRRTAPRPRGAAPPGPRAPPPRRPAASRTCRRTARPEARSP